MTQRTRRIPLPSLPPMVQTRHSRPAESRPLRLPLRVLQGLTRLVTLLSLVIIVGPERAEAQCTPDPPVAGGSVTCTNVISDGYDVREFDDLEISIEGNSVFDDSNPALDSAIRIGDETEITVGDDSRVNVEEENGFGIQGDDNNFISNEGTITVTGEGGRGIKIGDNTTGILDGTAGNGAVNGLTGSIIAEADGSVAMETGTNSGVATSGLIDLIGNNTRGISAGSREQLSFEANISNLGTLNVGGDDSFGIIAGDNWIDGIALFGQFFPQSSGIRNLRSDDPADGGVINVTGDRSFGIFAGDDSNTSGNHNSFVINGPGALIDVTGTDSIGISIGGNDTLDPSNTDLNNLYTFENAGVVMGGANAGPLVQIRNFVAGFENRILNTETGVIQADPSNLGTAGRGIAVMGSDGDDVVSNLGFISGNVDLGLGNDTYFHGENATFEDNLFLGEGNNSFRNEGVFSSAVTFGLGNQRVENFGTIESEIAFGAGDDFYFHGPEADLFQDILSLGEGDNTFQNQGTINTTVTFGTGDDFINNEGTIETDLILGDGDDAYFHREGAVMNNLLDFGDGNSRFFNGGDYDQPVLFGTGNHEIINTGTLTGDFNLGAENDGVRNAGEIDGAIDLGEGDDIYRLDSFDASVSGTINGGSGEDTIELGANPSSNPAGAFDLDQTTGFETVRLMSPEPGSVVGAGAGGWTLSGTEGFFGLTEVLSDATLRVDTPSVFAGALRLAPNSTVELPVDGTTPALSIQGATTLAGTAALNLTAGAAALPQGTPIRVIETLGGQNGRFDAVTFDAPAVDGVLLSDYDEDGFFVFFDPSLAALTSGASQKSIAQHLTDLDNAGSTRPEFQAFIDGIFASNQAGATDLTSVFSAISPEGYDAQTTVLVEGGRQIAKLLLDRPRECEAGDLNRFTASEVPLPCHARSWAPWLAATGTFRSRQSFDGHSEYDARIGGLVFGIDAKPIGDVDFTFAVATQHGRIEVDGFGTSTVTMTDLSAHLAWSPGAFRLQAVGSWGHGFHEDRRQIRVDLSPEIAPVRATSDTDHDSDRATLAFEAGYLIDLGPVLIEPLVGIDWAWVNQRTVDEEAAPFGLAVTIEGREDEVGSVSGGLRFSTVYQQERYVSERLEWMDGIWRPFVDVRWRQIIEGDERDWKARFDGASNDASSFTVRSEEDAGGVEIGAGLSFIPKMADRLQFDLRYEAYVAENTLQQDLVGQITLGF